MLSPDVLNLTRVLDQERYEKACGMVTVHHVTKRGAHVSETISLACLADRLAMLAGCRIEAVARNAAGEDIGAAWKNEGRWTWWCHDGKTAKCLGCHRPIVPNKTGRCTDCYLFDVL